MKDLPTDSRHTIGLLIACIVSLPLLAFSKALLGLAGVAIFFASGMLVTWLPAVKRVFVRDVGLPGALAFEGRLVLLTLRVLYGAAAVLASIAAIADRS
jgi:hypothetical protein